MEPPQDTVLLVDDEPGIRETLARAIRRARPDVRVLLAGNGEEALRLIADERIDVIVSDHRMPGMTGMEFLERAYKTAPDVPRVMMTAYPELELLLRGTNGAHLARFIPKPFQMDAAMRTIGALLDERRAKQAREAALARALELASRRVSEG